MAVSYTKSTLTQLVRRHVRAGGQLMLTAPNQEADIRLACRQLAEMVKDSPALSPLIMREYSLTFTSQEAPLPTSAEILYSSLPGAKVLVTGYTAPFSWYNREQDMQRGRVTLPRWTMDNNKVQVRSDPAVPDATTGTIEACFVPVVTDSTSTTTVDDELIPMLVDILAGWWAGVPSASPETPAAQ